MYNGWDVHSYSKDWAPILTANHPFLLERISSLEFETTCTEIKTYYSKSVIVQSTLEKFKNRFKTENTKVEEKEVEGGYYDSDLGKVNCAKLLVETWKKIKQLKEDSLYQLFEETLNDINNTCVQGDSHRLFALYHVL